MNGHGGGYPGKWELGKALGWQAWSPVFDAQHCSGERDKHGTGRLHLSKASRLVKYMKMDRWYVGSAGRGSRAMVQ